MIRLHRWILGRRLSRLLHRDTVCRRWRSLLSNSLRHRSVGMSSGSRSNSQPGRPCILRITRNFPGRNAREGRWLRHR